MCSKHANLRMSKPPFTFLRRHGGRIKSISRQMFAHPVSPPVAIFGHNVFHALHHAKAPAQQGILKPRFVHLAWFCDIACLELVDGVFMRHHSVAIIPCFGQHLGIVQNPLAAKCILHTNCKPSSIAHIIVAFFLQEWEPILQMHRQQFIAQLRKLLCDPTEEGAMQLLHHVTYGSWRVLLPECPFFPRLGSHQQNVLHPVCPELIHFLSWCLLLELQHLLNLIREISSYFRHQKMQPLCAPCDMLSVA